MIPKVQIAESVFRTIKSCQCCCRFMLAVSLHGEQSVVAGKSAASGCASTAKVRADSLLLGAGYETPSPSP